MKLSQLIRDIQEVVDQGYDPEVELMRSEDGSTFVVKVLDSEPK